MLPISQLMINNPKSHYIPLYAGRYWMDNVLCTGNEHELAKCRFDGWGRTDCRGGEAAGVICGGEDLPNATLNLVDKEGKSKIRDVHQRGIAVRLAGPRQGRLELKLPDSGEYIYIDSFDSIDFH